MIILFRVTVSEEVDQLTRALVMPLHHCLQLLYIHHVNKVALTLSQYFAGVSQPFYRKVSGESRVRGGCLSAGLLVFPPIASLRC